VVGITSLACLLPGSAEPEETKLSRRSKAARRLSILTRLEKGAVPDKMEHDSRIRSRFTRDNDAKELERDRDGRVTDWKEKDLWWAGH
jgi:hypothetical protein